MSTVIEDSGMVSLGVEIKKKKNCQPRILHLVPVFFRNDGRRNAMEKKKARKVSRKYRDGSLSFK